MTLPCRLRSILAAWLGGFVALAVFADEPAQPHGLLIIAPDRLLPALTDFVAHKRSLLPTATASLEKVLIENEGVDDPEKLKRFLFKKWNENRIGYALLVGDVDAMPVRYMVLDRVTPAAFNYAFYPSDLYYSDLAKADGSFDDWNGEAKDFHALYFGEVRGEANKEGPINFDHVDYLPEIAVGRWPVSDENGVRALAQKTITYERQILADNIPALRRARLIGVDGWVDTRSFLGKLSGLLADRWKTEQIGLPLKSEDGKPLRSAKNHAAVANLFNEGTGLVLHTGHGQPDRWEQCFSTKDLEKLTNKQSTPIVLSAGCSTAHFAPLPPYEAYTDIAGQDHVGTDQGEVFTSPPPPANPYQRSFNPSCLGDKILTQSETGAVAYIGCNTGSQPCALALMEGFVTALRESKSPTLGGCWNDAIRYYSDCYKLPELKPTESWTPPSIYFQGMKFMVFGDPSLKLPGESRATLSTSADLGPAFAKWGLTVRDQGGRPTCSVFTITGALEFAISQKLQRGERLSVEYLNWASNDVVKQAQDGGFFRDLWRGFVRHGICREEAMPYAPAFDSAAQPSTAALAAGKEAAAYGLEIHWIKKWDVTTGLTQAHVDGIKQTLRSGWPVCGGFRWPAHEHWENDTLAMCDAADVFDGHSILLIGFKDDDSLPGGGAYLCRNTNNGGREQWIPYAYAERFMNDAAWIGDETDQGKG